MNALNGNSTVNNNAAKCICNNKGIINIQIRVKVANSYNNSRSVDRIVGIANTARKTLVRIVGCTIAIYIITKFSVNIHNLIIVCC